MTMEEKVMTNEVYDNYGEAFLASKAKSLYDLIVTQGAQLLEELGALTPSNCTSIMLLLESYDAISTVQIAQKLNKSHQLISQRINRLEKLQLIQRTLSDADKRAKVIALTKEGIADLEKVKQACRLTDQHFQALYHELNLNIGQTIEQMKDTLIKYPIQTKDTES